jgi:hypothetical protein
VRKRPFVYHASLECSLPVIFSQITLKSTPNATTVQQSQANSRKIQRQGSCENQRNVPSVRALSHKENEWKHWQLNDQIHRALSHMEKNLTSPGFLAIRDLADVDILITTTLIPEFTKVLKDKLG